MMVDGQDAPEYRGGGGSAGSMQVHSHQIEGTGAICFDLSYLTDLTQIC